MSPAAVDCGAVTAPVAVVTGAADGIGWVTAQCLAKQGWCVALLD